MQTWKHGKLRPDLDNAFKSVVCMVRDCGRTVFAHNICRTHYEQIQTDEPLRPIQTIHSCIIAGCDDRAVGLNLCPAHKDQLKRGLAFRPIRRHQDYGTEPCHHEGCTSRAKTKGLCAKHYMVTRNGTTGKSFARGNVPCRVCGETRGTERCHIVAQKDGGTWDPSNIVPLCPTHHYCFDHHRLTDDEFARVFAAPEDAEQLVQDVQG